MLFGSSPERQTRIKHHYSAPRKQSQIDIQLLKDEEMAEQKNKFKTSLLSQQQDGVNLRLLRT